jgi:hypothetical protein
MRELTIADKFNVTHIRQEGARFHVLSFGGYISSKTGQHFGLTWCSEPFCEVNATAISEGLQEGLDPIKHVPAVAAREWLKSDAGRRALQAEGGER